MQLARSFPHIHVHHQGGFDRLAYRLNLDVQWQGGRARMKLGLLGQARQVNEAAANIRIAFVTQPFLPTQLP